MKTRINKIFADSFDCANSAVVVVVVVVVVGQRFAGVWISANFSDNRKLVSAQILELWVQVMLTWCTEWLSCHKVTENAIKFNICYKTTCFCVYKCARVRRTGTRPNFWVSEQTQKWSANKHQEREKCQLGWDPSAVLQLFVIAFSRKRGDKSKWGRGFEYQLQISSRSIITLSSRK